MCYDQRDVHGSKFIHPTQYPTDPTQPDIKKDSSVAYLKMSITVLYARYNSHEYTG